MKPRFRVTKDDSIIISDNFISNRHWMIKRHAADKIKVLDKYMQWKNGRYEGNTVVNAHAPDMDKAFINFTDKADSKAEFTLKALLKHDLEVERIELKNDKDIKIHVAHRYAPLLMLCDTILSSDNKGPLIGVIKNDKVLAVMPLQQ